MQLMSNIKKAAAAFVGAVTMAVAVPTAMFADNPVMADEPSGADQMTTVPFMTTTTGTEDSAIPVYNDVVGEVMIVGSSKPVSFENYIIDLEFPDEMLFVEDGTERTVRAEELEDGTRKWTGKFIEFTVDKKKKRAEVTALKEGKTKCLVDFCEEDLGSLESRYTYMYISSVDKDNYCPFSAWDNLALANDVVVASGIDYPIIEDKKLLVGSAVNVDIAGFPYESLIFPDEMTFYEQDDDMGFIPAWDKRTVKAETLENGARRWTGRLIEITAEKDKPYVVVKALAEGKTTCLIGWGEESYYVENGKYNSFLCIDSMDQAAYDDYIGCYNGEPPTEDPFVGTEKFYADIGWTDIDYCYVGQKITFEVKNPLIDQTIRFVDSADSFGTPTKESDTSKFVDVKDLGEGKFELTAKAEGSTCMYLGYKGSQKKGCVYIRVYQGTLAGNFSLPTLFADGTDDEKTLMYDLADYFYYVDEQGEWIGRDPDEIVSVEAIAYKEYKDIFKEEKNPVPVASIEPTDKHGVYKITALEPGYEFIYFTDKDGISWEMWVYVTTHAAVEAQEEYLGQHPTDTCWATVECWPTSDDRSPTEFGGTVSAADATVAAGCSVKLGDVNNDYQVTLADSLAILQYLANSNKYGLSDRMLLNADIVDRGEGVTAQDALAIQKIDAKALKESDLPIKSSQL